MKYANAEKESTYECDVEAKLILRKDWIIHLQHSIKPLKTFEYLGEKKIKDKKKSDLGITFTQSHSTIKQYCLSKERKSNSLYIPPFTHVLGELLEVLTINSEHADPLVPFDEKKDRFLTENSQMLYMELIRIGTKKTLGFPSAFHSILLPDINDSFRT